jgi:uncharacterized repeat protein (TIGR01451 family)
MSTTPESGMISRTIALLTLAGALTTGAYGQYVSSVFAGGGPPNGSAATSIAISNIYGTAVDGSGNVYVPSFHENRVYKVATNGTVTTVAGNGTSGYSGDGGAATSAQLNEPMGLAIDASGNLYIADYGNSSIRKVSGGVITTVAGNGTSGYSGDGGLATSAELRNPYGVALDSAGNLYIADTYNYRIRKVSGGVITTVAGNGTIGYSGDNGAATSAELSYPFGVAVDGAGANLYIGDSNSSRVRRVSSGIITTFAGNGSFGFSGDGGSATSAELSYPYGVAVDASGNVYIADIGNERIRKVSSGVITTVAGNGTYGFSGDGGSATSATLGEPLGVAVDSLGNFYIADTFNDRIRKVSGGVINTIAGNGSYEYFGDFGSATSAQINPAGVAADTLGNLYIADYDDFRVRKVTGGTISTVAGNGTSGYSGDTGPATSAEISTAQELAVDSAGDYYIGDSYRIREVAGGVITTVAGNGTSGYSGDGGPATSAEINNPLSLAATTPGNFYIADQSNSRIRKVSGGVISLFAGSGPPNGSAATSTSLGTGSVGTAADSAGNVYFASPTQNRVYKVATNGTISTVAGNGTSGYSGDSGAATSAQLNNPQGVAIDGFGNLYIADNGNERIRKVSSGVITTVAGTGSANFGGDGGLATSAQINNPQALATDSSGNFYIADAGNNRVRKVSGGVITTVAGNGSPGYAGDGGMATSAELNFPQGVAVDSSGNLYIDDNSNYRIRKVSGGIITTVAGNGVNAFGGDGGSATSAHISVSSSVAVDGTGNLYISDFGNDRIRRVSGGIITTFAGNGTYGFSGDSGPATSAELHNPTAVAVDGSGNVYIGDRDNDRIRKVTGGIISTIAGNGFSSFSGDGGSALNAQLNSPQGIAVDSVGDLYISDSSNSRVRFVGASSGNISTFAGGGTQNPGNGGPATSAALNSPGPVAVDSSNNVYFIDGTAVRKVSGGIITTIDTLANSGAQGISVDNNGRVYISDSTNGRVLLLSASTLAPSISNISPDNATAGGPGFTLSVTGSGFVSGAVVQWNGSALVPTTFNSSSSLSATVPASLIATPGTASITVMEGGSTSNAASFTILSVVTCSYTLTPSSMSVPITGGAETTVLTTNLPSCGYTVQSNNSWIHITSGASGTGSGTIGYSVDPNSGAPQTGTFTVLSGGDLAVTTFIVNQAGVTCTGLTVSPTAFTFSQQSGNGTVTLNPGGCQWTVTSNSTWLHPPTPASGSASTFTFTVDANSSATRSGTLTVNGILNITVTQTGLVCTYSMAPTGLTFGSSQSFSSSGGGGGINVTATAGCAWTVTPTGTPFSNVSGGATGNGPISYGVSQNTTGTSRTGTINITDFSTGLVVLSFVVNQAAPQQGYSCTAASTPSQLRGEGLTELLPDLVLTCTGTPIAGATGDVLVSFTDGLGAPVSISNRLVSTGGTDSLLLVDDPPASALNVGVNVFRGLLGGVNYLVFPSVPLAVGNVFTLRITNVRVYGGSSNGLINASVSFVSSTPFTGPSSTPMATVQSGSGFTMPATMSGPNTGQTIQPLQFSALIPNAYRPRLTAGQDPSVAGTVYNSESGYVNTAVLGPQTGFATTGTRFLVSVSNVPASVTLYAPLMPVSGSHAQLMSADNTGSGGIAVTGGTVFGGVAYQPIPVTAGVGTATWEVTSSSAAFTFNLLINNPFGVNLSSMTIAGSLAAQTGGGGVSAVAPIPRFVGGAVPAAPLVTLNLGVQAGVPAAVAAVIRARHAALSAQSSMLAPTVTFAQTVTNTCPTTSCNPVSNTATNGVLGGTLPPSWNITDCLVLDNGGVCQLTGAGNGFGVTYPTLGPGGSATVVVSACFGVFNGTSCQSSVAQTGVGPEYDSSFSSDLFGAGSSFSGYLQMENPPMLGLAIGDSGPFVQGGNATYTLTLSNLTNNQLNLSTVQVRDELPPGLTYVSMTAMTGSGWVPCSVNPQPTCLQFPSPSLAAAGLAGSSLPPITVHAMVAANAPSSVTNQVTVSEPANNIVALIGDDKQIVQPSGCLTTPVLTSPTNGSIGVALLPSLSWGAVAGATSYNVYFGTSPTPPSLTTVTGTSYAPGPLISGTTYYWQIVAINGSCTATSPTWSFTTMPPSSGGPVIPILDFNADSKQDVFLYDPVGGTGYAGLSNGSGAFTYVYNAFTPGFDTIRYGNFISSGPSGLVAYNSSSTLGYTLLGTGSGTFNPVSLFWGPGYTKVAAGDLNGDGLTDFVIYRPSDGTSYTAISNGDGTFHYQYTLVSVAFTHLVVADFNGDGKADVFFYRSTDGLAYLGIGNGTGGFTFSPVTLGPAYGFIEAGDINGDGKADLLLYASSSGATAVGLSTGSGFTLTPYYYSPGFTTVKLFDFNGDGKADLAFYNMNTAVGYLGIGDGTGNFAFSSLFWGLGMSTVDTLDLNNDGKIDVVLYNTTNGASYTGISSGNPASPFTYQYAYWGNGRVLATTAAQP